MGKEQAGRRKQLHFCIALLILIETMGCSLYKAATSGVLAMQKASTARQSAASHIDAGRTLLAKGAYASALKENGKALALAGPDVPADEALFYIGLIYAHPDSPVREYGKSLFSLNKLLRGHPRSSFAEQAKVIMALLQEEDRRERTIERLNKVIEELNKVDITIEHKKKERQR